MEAEDYTISPSGPLLCRVSVAQVEGKYLGEFDTQDVAESFIREDMDRNQFWPDIWLISDHGNVELLEG